MKKYSNQINDELWDTQIGNDLSFAVELLSDDEVVAIPTETVYGLAGNAFSKKAINKIYQIKKRPFSNPLIVHVADVTKINEIAKDIPKIALELLEKFSPGPLTVLLPKKATILDEVTAGLKDVAIRIPNHQLTIELLKKLDFPLVAPSANPYGYISPTKPSHVYKQLGSKIPYILDGGSCDKGIESTVVGFENGKIIIYRLGVISLEMIAEVSKDVIIRDTEKEKPLSPGMVPHHYSPHTKLILTDKPEEVVKFYKVDEVAFIGFKNKLKVIPAENQLVLSCDGNLNEAAQNLYHALHLMDDKNLKVIIAEKMPNEGIGKSINDRLTRASHHKKE
ncbi:MAG: L-threonylcarbamoyladenylate synthase [Flavobacteriaceae bacterium]|nr:L-threonylcarbamoyladenylate synthase [Flavobacteriaceae bacterium]